MTIFIGRNIERNTKIWLKENKVDYIALSLIDIRLKPVDFSFLPKRNEDSISFVVSSNWAAQWLLNFHQQIQLSSIDNIYCISQKQAELLSGLGCLISVSENQNRKSLEHLLKEKSAKNLVFLKGNRTKSFNNSQIKEIEVYDNQILKPELKKVFEAYLFFSPSGILSFIEGGNTIPGNSNVFVIGETTAEKARECFSNPVFVSPRQNELSVVKLAVTKSKGLLQTV